MLESNGTEIQNIEPPFRVAITENSKGEPSVSVRAALVDPDLARRHAVEMYRLMLQDLGLERPGVKMEDD